MAKAIYTAENADQTKETKRVENERHILLLLSLKAKHVRIELEGRKIFFVFYEEDVDKQISRLLSAEPIMVDVHDFFLAQATWKDAVVSSKSYVD